MHLTNESLKKLLAGTVSPAEARALGDHLDNPCPRCEALLAGHEGTELDALADHSLTALSEPTQEECGNDIEYARIRRAVQAVPAKRARRSWIPGVAAAAALLVAVAGVLLNLDRARDDRWDGVKGVAQVNGNPVSVRLSAVAVAAGSGSEPRLWRVVSGDELPPSAALQLRVELGKPADVVIARVGPEGQVDLFWHERAPAAGAVTVTAGGRPAAYPLEALAGPQVFVVLASHDRLTPERIRGVMSGVLGAGRAVAGGVSPQGVSVDVLSVTVR